jgi:hypothetical protein
MTAQCDLCFIDPAAGEMREIRPCEHGRISAFGAHFAGMVRYERYHLERHRPGDKLLAKTEN